ncbi:hypothetical protein AK812_SmicGene47722, partial [Symbiodinium microadriaticum]
RAGLAAGGGSPMRCSIPGPPAEQDPLGEDLRSAPWSSSA